MAKYVATEWATVADKEKFEKQFKRFVLSDFKRSLFTKAFYNRLSNCFGHIAHYDINGFYDTFFTCLTDKIRFLEITRQGNAGFCAGGDPDEDPFSHNYVYSGA